jgi:hypothetical protein
MTRWCCNNYLSTCRKIKINPYLSPVTNNSIWIKDLHVRPETLKLLEESIGEMLQNGQGLLDPDPQNTGKKVKTEKWDFIELKSFCTTKEKIYIPNDNQQTGRKYLQTMYATIDEFPEDTRNSKKLIAKAKQSD